MSAANSSRERIVVAMSGGVDSSVAAGLLVEAGHDVIGLTMQLYDRREMAVPVEGSCCSIDDVTDARRVAERLGIPFYVVNFEDAFQALVVDNLVEEYLAGRTPNPCARCNEFMKFRLLLKRALELGASALATGHYARIVPAVDGGRARLWMGRDLAKDQSYFLHAISQSTLERLRFPLGDLTKEEVRAHAARMQLPTAEKAESQDVCFVAGERYVDFISRTIPAERVPVEVEILDGSGAVIGEHRGHHHYTVGQRRGLGVASSVPLHVLSTDAERNRVVVGPREALEVMGLRAERVQWIAGEPPPLDIPLEARVRYRSTPVGARIVEAEGAEAQIRFEAPVDAVSPGQVVVLYRGGEVLGGGTIAETLPAPARRVEGAR